MVSTTISCSTRSFRLASNWRARRRSSSGVAPRATVPAKATVSNRRSASRTSNSGVAPRKVLRPRVTAKTVAVGLAARRLATAGATENGVEASKVVERARTTLRSRPAPISPTAVPTASFHAVSDGTSSRQTGPTWTGGSASPDLRRTSSSRSVSAALRRASSTSASEPGLTGTQATPRVPARSATTSQRGSQKAAPGKSPHVGPGRRQSSNANPPRQRTSRRVAGSLITRSNISRVAVEMVANRPGPPASTAATASRPTNERPRDCCCQKTFGPAVVDSAE